MIRLLLAVLLCSSVVRADTWPPVRVQSSADASPITSYNLLFPNFTGTHTGSTFSLGVNSVAGGGTGSTSFTTGSIPFSNGTILTQNNSNLFWDNTNLRLGIGTATPTAALQILGSAAGNLSATITNTDAVNSNSSSWILNNDASATASLSLFGSTFGVTYLQNGARVAGSNALWLSSDVNSASGGTDPIVLTPGGYNNEEMRVTTSGVGIKNTSPSYTLDVTGTMRATTSITDGGFAASTAGAPVSVNSSGTLVSGISYTETTLTTATAIGTGGTNLMVTTPAAGTYRVDGSVNISAASAAGNTLTCGILYNSAYNASSFRSATPIETGLGGTFQNMNISTHGIVVANGTASIGLGCASSAGTVTVNYGTVDIVRIQ